MPKANHHIYEHKYICDQNWVKFPSLGREIWCSQGFLVIACCDLISMSQALIHTSPNFGEISSNIHEHIVFTRFSGHCLQWPRPLTFWPQNLISISTNANTCDQKWVKLPSLVWEIWSRCRLPAVTLTFDWPFNVISMTQAQIHKSPNFGEISSNNYGDIVFILFSGSLPVVTLTFDLWSQRLISTSMNPNTSVTKIGWNSLHWFLRYGVHKVLGSLPAVTLNFDLLAPESKQHIHGPKYKIGRNSHNRF